MSWQDVQEAECALDTQCNPVDLVIKPKIRDLGGFKVKRVLPVRARQMVGPFIFFDQMGPSVLPPEAPVNVRPHPHIGLSTLTWMFDGVIMHRDSLGYAQEIKPGEINWMTAGSGIVHSERTPERLKGQTNTLFGLQIWMALPKTHEETDPSFQHYGKDEIPTFEKDGVTGRVIAGDMGGLKSPVAVYWETLYVDVNMSKGSKFLVPADHEERAVYPLDGRLKILGAEFAPQEMIVLKPGQEVELIAVEETHLVLIGGAPMDGPREMFWNFVSSDKARLDKAKSDWVEGRFAKVPGDEVEFIPLPGS